MEAIGIPGVAIGVLDGGEETVRGFGVTSVEHPLDVDGDTLFQIGSITKTFTCTVVMRLVEEGRLDLDAPLRTYLPELRLRDEDVASRVTMRHLLTHTGGWVGDYFDDTGPGDDALGRMCERLVDLPQETPLGELWAYNNAGFYLAGRIVEVVVGRPFEHVLRELVLEAARARAHVLLRRGGDHAPLRGGARPRGKGGAAVGAHSQHRTRGRPRLVRARAPPLRARPARRRRRCPAARDDGGDASSGRGRVRHRRLGRPHLVREGARRPDVRRPRRRDERPDLVAAAL